MAILVTGASGFIGTHVVAELVERGDEVVAFDLAPRRPLKGVFIQGTITDINLLRTTFERYNIDRVIHLAGLLQFKCNQEPKQAIEVNVAGTLNVIEVAKTQDAKNFVFASSGAVYGSIQGPIRDNSPIYPGVKLYGAAKHVCEVLGSQYSTVYGMPFSALRYWGVYGPGEVATAGIAKVIKDIEGTASGRDVVIEAVGAVERRHFTYVKDAAHATVLAIDNPLEEPRVFNIAGGEESFVTFQQFYEVIKKLNPQTGKATFTGAGQDRDKVDISAARKMIGYNPRYSLEMGLGEVIEYVLKARS